MLKDTRVNINIGLNRIARIKTKSGIIKKDLKIS